LLRDGVPLAALEGREVLHFPGETQEAEEVIQRRLRVGSLPASLRPYYA
jgi:hypothetical protein